MARRYVRASKKEWGLMLDEPCARAGSNRRYAPRLLRERGAAPPHRQQRRVRKATSEHELLPALPK